MRAQERLSTSPHGTLLAVPAADHALQRSARPRQCHCALHAGAGAGAGAGARVHACSEAIHCCRSVLAATLLGGCRVSKVNRGAFVRSQAPTRPKLCDYCGRATGNGPLTLSLEQAATAAAASRQPLSLLPRRRSHPTPTPPPWRLSRRRRPRQQWHRATPTSTHCRGC